MKTNTTLLRYEGEKSCKFVTVQCHVGKCELYRVPLTELIFGFKIEVTGTLHGISGCVLLYCATVNAAWYQITNSTADKCVVFINIKVELVPVLFYYPV